ncbi:MAG: sulfate ABC transporter ATP-binding protein [Dehalococcoidia bacterium]|nr:sulfate ABC transporter ATP-binding protein [Dehalococcoidia bacterium]
MSVVVKNLDKKFGSFGAVNNVSFEVQEGELAALLGPSGAGKSTILRMIGGLEQPDTGTIELDGVDVSRMSPQQRGAGFVFQSYALFKHMTITQNIAFGLEVRHVAKNEVRERVRELLNLVKLDGYGNHYPSQLSGGQRQRVALARALAPRPRVMLLDEPFGALDARVRVELREWIRRLHDDVHVTSIFVTHDQEEALEISDKIVVINEGNVEQIGSPSDLYDRPATPFVASFIGPINVFKGEAAEGKATFGHMSVPLPRSMEQATGAVDVFIRPFDFFMSTEGHDGRGVEAKVQRVALIGGSVKLSLVLFGGERVEVQLDREHFGSLDIEVGEEVWLTPKAAKVFSKAHQPLA